MQFVPADLLHAPRCMRYTARVRVDLTRPQAPRVLARVVVVVLLLRRVEQLLVVLEATRSSRVVDACEAAKAASRSGVVP